jgi:(S)-mandelate dehydrogenase
MHYTDAINVEDLRTIAQRKFTALRLRLRRRRREDERTLAGNREAFARLRFRPRTLVDVSKRALSAQMLGTSSALPVVVGPTGLNGLCWRDGDLALARAASKADVPFAMSTVSMSLVEDIARQAPGRLWLQAYVFAERHITEAILARARDADFECAILTSDFPVTGKRERDLRTGLLPAQQFTLATKLDMLAAPALARDRRDAAPALREHRARAAARTRRQRLRRAFDVRPFVLLGRREALPRPLAAQAPPEGRAARGRRGARAGRGLRRPRALEPRRPPARRRHQRTRRAARGRPRVGGRASILVGRRRAPRLGHRESGRARRRGRACSAARPVYGLAAGGEAGVAHALAILADELDRTLALTGCTSVSGLSQDLVAQA